MYLVNQIIVLYLLPMKLKEAISEVKCRVKPYNEVGIPQSTYVNTMRNIEAGLSKPKTIEKFMARFGYVAERSELWIKK
jgi:hypothetical protein